MWLDRAMEKNAIPPDIYEAIFLSCIVHSTDHVMHDRVFWGKVFSFNPNGKPGNWYKCYCDCLWYSIVCHCSYNIVTVGVTISSIYPSPNPSPNPPGGVTHLAGGAYLCFLIEKPACYCWVSARYDHYESTVWRYMWATPTLNPIWNNKIR